MLLHHFLIVEVCVGFYCSPFPLPDLTGRMFPDTPLGITADLMRPGLCQKLGLVGSFHTNIFVLNLMDFAVSIGPHTSPRHHDRLVGKARRLRRLLTG